MSFPLEVPTRTYFQTSNIGCTLVGNRFVDHSASTGDVLTTSSFSTSMDWGENTGWRDEKHLSFGIWSALYQRFDGSWQQIQKHQVLNVIEGTYHVTEILTSNVWRYNLLRHFFYMLLCCNVFVRISFSVDLYKMIFQKSLSSGVLVGVFWGSYDNICHYHFQVCQTISTVRSYLQPGDINAVSISTYRKRLIIKSDSRFNVIIRSLQVMHLLLLYWWCH